MKQRGILKVQLDCCRTLAFRGRDAWALLQLTTARDKGCTAVEHPGPRWSGYVHKLRKAGIVIETVREPHGGQFPGQHARYVLRSQITVLDNEEVEI